MSTLRIPLLLTIVVSLPSLFTLGCGQNNDANPTKTRPKDQPLEKATSEASPGRIAYDGGEILYSAGVELREARAVGETLAKSRGLVQNCRLVQLGKRDNRYHVRLVTQGAAEPDNQITESHYVLASLVSRECFREQPLDLEICDRQLTTIASTTYRPLPPEYMVVARQLGQPLRSSPKDYLNQKGTSSIIADGHSAVLDLRSVRSADSDITYLSSHGASAYADALKHLERLNALPRPRDANELLAVSFIHGLFGNVYATYALGVDADAKQQAILTEVQGFVAAAEKADAVHLLLPRVAERYAAPIASTPGRIKIDFDESWYATSPYDWCCLYNPGPDLDNCTVVIGLKGATGQARTNVHFAPSWPARTWMYARYDPGVVLNGRRVGTMSVISVDTIDAAVYSPTASTRIHYKYTGDEKDRDIATRCKNLQLQCRYQPFDSSLILPDTQRGVRLRLAGYPNLGACRVDATFRRGELMKHWSWAVNNWREGEEQVFTTPRGQQHFDPGIVALTLSFPGSNYKPTWVDYPDSSYGYLVADRDSEGEWERFRLVKNPDGSFSFEAHTGWLCAHAGGGGEVTADRLRPDAWERWNLLYHKDGSVSLRSASGHYLCAPIDGSNLNSSRTSVGEWERFRMQISDDGNTCSLRSSTGKYVSAQQ